jgi:uncharacterized Fe-S cluster protein YjdI/CDGSH-type Zn-finger protein
LAAVDEADAGSGGAGAPPEEHEANQVFADLTREYSSSDIRVQWFAARCIHSAACIRALPQVFNARRRPWIDVNAADADAIANAVLQCPTGALHYVRTNGTPEPAPDNVKVTAVRNGPYFIRGEVELTDSSGHLIRKDSRVALCRCGKSRHMPFCDNTHRAIGFRSEPDPA